MSELAFLVSCRDTNLTVLVLKKDWSLSEWITNFLQDDRLYYDDAEYEELYDDGMPGGDSGMGEMDDGVFESLLIVALAAALVFLVMYRQQRQQRQRREDEDNRRGHQQPAQAQAQQQQPGGAGGQGGFFPPPGDPNAGQWAAGGVGH